MAVAVRPAHPNNAWEDTIVPTLRKRLEQESRILENRLSVHSITSREDHPQPIQSASPRKQATRSPTPSHANPTSPAGRNFSDSYRPTAIPQRPNTSMAKESPMLYNPGVPERPHASAYNATKNGGTSASSSQHVPFTRSRTRSTPYPFDEDGQAPQGAGGRKTPNGRSNGDSTLNGMPTPASSRANSPMVSGPRPSEPRPSRIPVVTRKRARSSSNATSLESHVKASIGRAAANHPPGSKKGASSEDPHETHIFPPSPEASPDIWRDQDHSNDNDVTSQPTAKLRDETPIFNANRLSRAASFEEREYEHWYRGEGRDGGGRNGGRGEIKVAKAGTAKEMLDIAVGGHRIGGKDRWTTRRAPDAYDMDTRTRREAEEMDYVPDEKELTDIERDFSSDNVHDTGTAEDLHEYYYMASDEPRSSSSSHPNPAPSSSIPLPTPAPSRSRPMSPASQARPKPSLQKPRGPPAGAASPRKGSGTPAKPRAQSRPRQRAVSRPQPTPPAERPPPMADALPPWALRSPVPQDGNWDEVVLPTVAKKMGLMSASTTEVTMLGSDAEPSSKKRESVYEPAPGTFAYDAAKHRMPDNSRPMGEFGGKRMSVPLPENSIQYEYPPSRKESPPPFAAYGVEDGREEVQPPPPLHLQQVNPSKEDLRARQKELKKSKPAIVVTSPSELARATKSHGLEEDEDAGCCKCTIM